MNRKKSLFFLTAEEEVEEFVAISSALLVNMGTLSSPWIKSMHKAATKARELGKVWVLDPVGAGATNIRTKTATDLVISCKPTVIRGNPSEIMALAKSICTGINLQTSGKFQIRKVGKKKPSRSIFIWVLHLKNNHNLLSKFKFNQLSSNLSSTTFPSVR